MNCIVHAFAVAATGVADWAGHAPSVLGRQIARAIVAAANRDADRGLRFFPFVGTDGGRRCFLESAEVPPIELLRRLHGGSVEPRFVIAGRLMAEQLELVVHDAADGDHPIAVALPFDPREPFRAVTRALFELAAVLDLDGLRPRFPTLTPELTVRYLWARDALLALEARLLGVDAAAALQAAADAFVADAASDDTGELLLELAAAMIRQAESLHVVREVLAAATDRPGVPGRVLRRAAALLDAAGDPLAATGLTVRAARAHPEDVEIVLQAASDLIAQQRHDEARAVLLAALETGAREPRLRAWLAACDELTGRLASRDRLLGGLLDETGPDADPAVQRMVASWLVDAGRFDEAAARTTAALAVHPEHAGLWLEQGRAELGRGDAPAARRALRRCLDARPSAEGRAEALRLMRLADDDALLPEVVAVEEHLGRGEVEAARRISQRLVSAQPTLPESWLLHGVVLHRLGRRRGATRALERAIRLRPDFAEAHNRLGILLAERGRDARAWPHAQRAVELAPGDASAWLHYAQVAARVGEGAAAQAALRRVELLGEYPDTVAELRRRLA